MENVNYEDLYQNSTKEERLIYMKSLSTEEEREFRRNYIEYQIKNGHEFKSAQSVSNHYNSLFKKNISESSSRRLLKKLGASSINGVYHLPEKYKITAKESELRSLFKKAELVSIEDYEYLCIPIANGFSQVIVNVLTDYQPLNGNVIGMIPSKDFVLIICKNKDDVSSVLQQLLPSST